MKGIRILSDILRLAVGSSLFLACFSPVLAAPTVHGTTISWPDDGWYQVQNSNTYESVCQGGRSCSVTPGSYHVINLTTGQRFENIRVEEYPIVVNGNVISWPDDGWYQVQIAGDDYASICEGGDSCLVGDGTYNVINHTLGLRYENIVIGETETPPVDELPSAPSNVSIAFYGTFVAELFWDRAAAAEHVVRTEIFRDGELIGETNGTSYLDKTRGRVSADTFKSPYPGPWYELVAIDTDGNRSLAGTLDFQREDHRLVPEGEFPAHSFYPGGGLSGKYAIVNADAQQRSDGSDDHGTVHVFQQSDDGDWHQSQILEPSLYGSLDSQLVPEAAIDDDTLVLGVADASGGGVSYIVYTLDDSGNWIERQRLDAAENPGSGVLALQGDTIMFPDNVIDANDAVVRVVSVWERDQSTGQWYATQQLTEEPETDNYFLYGNDILIEGNTALVGVFENNVSEGGPGIGTLYVYERNADGLWEKTQRMQSRGNSDHIPFGTSMAFDGETLLIGLPNATFDRYERNSEGEFELQETIDAGSQYNQFDYTVPQLAVAGEHVLLGLDENDGLSRRGGVVLHLERVDDQWSVVDRLVSSNGIEQGQFGYDVHIDDGHRALVTGRTTGDDSGYTVHAPIEGYIFELN